MSGFTAPGVIDESGKAPELFGRGRECEFCSARVNRYTKRQFADTQGPVGPLLCSMCASNFDPTQYRSGRHVSGWSSRRANKGGVHLQGLRDARKRRGLSQEELAKRLGYARDAASKWERGKWLVGAGLAEDIARELGVEVRELRGDS